MANLFTEQDFNDLLDIINSGKNAILYDICAA